MILTWVSFFYIKKKGFIHGEFVLPVYLIDENRWFCIELKEIIN